MVLDNIIVIRRGSTLGQGGNCPQTSALPPKCDTNVVWPLKYAKMHGRNHWGVEGGPDLPRIWTDAQLFT